MQEHGHETNIRPRDTVFVVPLGQRQGRKAGYKEGGGYREEYRVAVEPAYSPQDATCVVEVGFLVSIVTVLRSRSGPSASDWERLHFCVSLSSVFRDALCSFRFPQGIKVRKDWDPLIGCRACGLLAHDMRGYFDISCSGSAAAGR